IVRAHAQELQAQLMPRSTADAVRQVITATLARGEATQAATAKRLGVSQRTLRRRLAEEDSSFRALLDEVRYACARTYLDQDRLSSTEMALLLGFADASTLYRAFRRWHGTSLSAYRAARSGAEQE
nr:helix-turn-helix domain-containing protein [Myxococcales bacterium]